jgi:threonine dehydratase
VRLPSLARLEEASQIVYAAMPATPQYSWPLLNARAGAAVWVKHENHTPVGAFKVRGGLVYLHELMKSGQPVPGIVSATRGNHGQSLAFAAGRHGVRSAVVVPVGNSIEKNAAMRALGADVIEAGADFAASSDAADQVAAERGWHRMASYAEPLVAGVGTYALELLRAAPPLDAVYVPIGLGSGISGMMAARDALGLGTEIIGVVSSLAPAYALSFAAGRMIEHASTTQIADGVACRRPDATAFPHIMSGVARVVTVTDVEVRAAMRACFHDTHNVAEGAGAAPLAALLQERERQRGRRVGIVLCGGNVDTAVFAGVLNERD